MIALKNRCFAVVIRSLILLPLLFISTLGFAKVSGKDLIKAVDDARMPSGEIVFRVSVDDYNGNKKIRSTVYSVSTRGEDSLVETLEPARQMGRKLLMKSDDLWFFSPDLKKPIRVSMQQRLTGEVANGDLARTNFAGDYDAKVESEETISGKPAYKLRLTANRKGVTYSQIMFWVSKENTPMPIKAEFYATGGKKLKQATYTGLQNIFGRKRVTKIIITDEVKKTSRSELIFSNFKKVKLDPSAFNKDSLSD